MSVRVLRGRLSVGTCSTRLGNCRYAFGEVGLVSGFVRRSRVSVGTFPKMSASCRDVFGVVGLVSGLVR